MAVKKQTVVVLGSEGMLGHQVSKMFQEHPGYITLGISGKTPHMVSRLGLLTPDIVINCIGVVPRSEGFADHATVFAANSVLPHQLLAECTRRGARLIHISSDCVFLGDKGNYSEQDTPNAIDLYGMSKLLGEVSAPNALTIRTSLIGPELRHKRGLLEWFLSQQGPAVGYTHAFFSGLTTIELAKTLRDFIVPSPMLHGILHVGGERISKFDLLASIKSAYGHDVVLARNDAIRIDRSLDSRKFELLTGYKAPTWHQMIREMHNASRT